MPNLGVVCLFSSAHRADDRRVAALNGMALVAHGYRALHVCVPARAQVLSLPTLGIQRHAGLAQRLIFLGRVGFISLMVRPRLIIASEPDTWLVALVAKISFGCKVIFDSHEDYTDRDRLIALPKIGRSPVAWAVRALFAVLAKFSDGTLFISAERVRVFTLKFCAPRIALVRNAICRREALEYQTGNAATMGRFDAVALGAMGRERGWPTIVKSLASSPNFLFRCIMIGRITDGSETALLDHVQRYGVAERLMYAGFLPRENALVMASNCQVGFVLFTEGGPNQKTALPHKLFEILMLGLPVIASVAAQMTVSLIREVGCGIAVETSQDTALSEKLVEVFFRPIDRAAMGELARLACLGRLAWDKDAETLADFCCRILENNRDESLGDDRESRSF